MTRPHQTRQHRMRTICARDKCNRLFTPGTRLWKGRVIDIVSCPKCRARNARYMRKRRALKVGKVEGHATQAKQIAVHVESTPVEDTPLVS